MTRGALARGFWGISMKGLPSLSAFSASELVGSPFLSATTTFWQDTDTSACPGSKVTKKRERKFEGEHKCIKTGICAGTGGTEPQARTTHCILTKAPTISISFKLWPKLNRNGNKRLKHLKTVFFLSPLALMHTEQLWVQ